MKSQTRQLVQLLADDTTAQLLECLRKEARTAPQLEKEVGASSRTIAHALELLHAHGVVGSEPAEPGAFGRPSRVWHIRADEDLVKFEQACDTFKANLLRLQLKDY